MFETNEKRDEMHHILETKATWYTKLFRFADMWNIYSLCENIFFRIFILALT
jgi:hypothetical protein